LGVAAVPEQGGGDGAGRQGGHDQHGVAGDRGVEADLGLIEAETVLAELKSSSTGQRHPAARISRALASGWPPGMWQ
jgi:hypothetical protein